MVLLFCACVPEGKPPIFTNLVRGAVGGACDTDADCVSGTCLLANFASDPVAAPGGYCSQTCTADADCSPGKCIAFGGVGYCTARCEKPSHCRDGYICDSHNYYCLPAAKLDPACDPTSASASCTTSMNRPGACIRVGLGSGDVGYCNDICNLDGTVPCPFGASCHFIDARQEGEAYKGDTFMGLACFNDSPEPVALGGRCQATTDCVNLAVCIFFTAFAECRPVCELGMATCNCKPFPDSPGLYGYCDP
jgi:hypothetical protein